MQNVSSPLKDGGSGRSAVTPVDPRPVGGFGLSLLSTYPGVVVLVAPVPDRKLPFGLFDFFDDFDLEVRAVFLPRSTALLGLDEDELVSLLLDETSKLVTSDCDMAHTR